MQPQGTWSCDTDNLSDEEFRFMIGWCKWTQIYDWEAFCFLAQVPSLFA